MTALITPADRIFVAGNRGMAGTAICRDLQRAGYTNLLTPSRAELNLEDGPAVQRWFAEHKPTMVVLAAAKVGGIQANNSYPADFTAGEPQNSNECDRNGLAIRGAAPVVSGQQLHLPEVRRAADQGRGPAQRAAGAHERVVCDRQDHGLKLCEALRKQHSFDAISLMVTNLYGPGDNYNRENSHVLPALIRLFHEAAEAKAPSVSCWGTGTPRREFLHVHDLGEACVFALERWQPGAEDPPFLNVGTGVDLTISALAEAVAQATDFQGEILWSISKPDGTPKKQPDVSRLAALDWCALIPLAQGLASTVAEFREQLRAELVRL